MNRFLLTMALFTLLVRPFALAITEKPNQETKNATVTINFDDQDLIKVVKWLSEKTKQNFIVDESLRHVKINIFTGTPVTLDEAYQAFVNAIEAEGIQLVAEGKFVRITRRRIKSNQPTEFQPCPTLSNISQVDDSTFRIADNAIKNLDENDPCLTSQARLVPNFSKHSANIRIFSIRPDSVWAQMGLKNGDVVRQIDGQIVSSSDDVLKIFEKLKANKQIKLELSRQGKLKVFNYQISTVQQKD